MNAGGVSKACKSNGAGVFARIFLHSGKRVSNTLVIYPWDGYNLPKGELMSDGHEGAQAILM